MRMAILAPHLLYQGLLPFAEGREGKAVATHAWSLPDCHMCRHDLAKHGGHSHRSVNPGCRYFIVQDGSLDVASMRAAAAMLLGEHDFRHFCKVGYQG